MAESQSFSGKEVSAGDCANGFHKIFGMHNESLPLRK